MATIDSVEIINTIIFRNGYYPGDENHRVYQIVEYTNAWGNVTWGVSYFRENEAYRHRYEVESEYVRNPKVIWKADGN